MAGTGAKETKELDLQIAQLKAMRRLVDQVLTCQCAELADCGAFGVIRHGGCTLRTSSGRRLARELRKELHQFVVHRIALGRLAGSDRCCGAVTKMILKKRSTDST